MLMILQSMRYVFLALKIKITLGVVVRLHCKAQKSLFSVIRWGVGQISKPGGQITPAQLSINLGKRKTYES